MQERLDQKKLRTFKTALAPFLKAPRQFPWRETTDPYCILVSEIMLQQTQTGRVIEKYQHFIKIFPTTRALASAPTREVLTAWSGLGYNRRALYLQGAARAIQEHYGGKIPDDPNTLEALPGIGHYTARAIAAFAFNKPHPFVETNIRTVFLHHFFSRTRKLVTDAALLSIVETALDTKQPRRWYAALMDYGAHLKTAGNKIHQKSKLYVKQSRFEGSNRQLRGKILKLLLQEEKTFNELVYHTTIPTEKLQSVLAGLVKEKLVTKKGVCYAIA